jgi:hypothetical protein
LSLTGYNTTLFKKVIAVYNEKLRKPQIQNEELRLLKHTGFRLYLPLDFKGSVRYIHVHRMSDQRWPKQVPRCHRYPGAKLGDAASGLLLLTELWDAQERVDDEDAFTRRKFIRASQVPGMRAQTFHASHGKFERLNSEASCDFVA